MPSLSIGNNRVKLTLDGRTGFIRDIFSKETGIHHKCCADDGIWPFGMRLGDRYSPDILRVEINGSDKCSSQRMTHKTITRKGAKTLRMRYKNMLATGGTPSGIDLTVEITLKRGADYFLITADVTNGSEYGITNLYSGWGGLVAAESAKDEHLAVPDWSLGTIWDNPRKDFQQRETFGYPIFGSQGCMVSGWMDLYGPEGGIGIGYLNKQGLTMFFNIHSEPAIPNRLAPPKSEGLAFNWQLFNLIHGKANETLATVGGTYPLEPGQRFKTDPWILAPHAGDWHRMADIYRSEYEQHFKGDYLTWEDTHETAKKIDLTAYYSMTIDKDGTKKFKDIPPAFDAIIKRSGVEPGNLLTGVLALWHSPLNWPDHFPRGMTGPKAEAAIAAYEAMAGQLRAMGVEAITLFTHLFYNHRDANDYTPAAETGHDHENVIWYEIGNNACMDTDEWQSLWADHYIPGYASVDCDGVMLDQGPTQYLVCTRGEHRHGNDGPAMLGSHTAATLEIVHAFRKGYPKKRPVLLWTECASDLPTRWCDIWSGWDGEPETGRRAMEIVRYTFPYRPMSYTAFKEKWTVEDVMTCTVNSLLVGGYYGFDAAVRWPRALDEPIRQYVRIRQELRQQNAPGFPQGFKDTIGLTVSTPNLVAKVYANESGATIIYYAKKNIRNAKVALDLAALGLAKKNKRSKRTFRVSLKTNEAGYKIIR
ncbi:hypothetical protein LCGC14_0467660 [marine sediment metagenome]|uniref:Uncharacterized protein n=1 Tax=marine sediment metagenome TaxID=412755 RepID=A0A0F9UZZ0_9ZZZZ|nr:hypothetical protein [Phycisphaerae bacterium]HDZ44325.1 hypothetical protein [Phycisphaerae bacterium]